MVYEDRAGAGRALAAKLTAYANRSDVIVLALPRGGVPVAFEVAEALDAPLDVFVVRKLGVPGHEEFAMGAIASGGIRVVNEDVVRALGIPEEAIDAVAERERRELERRSRAYRGDGPPVDVRGRVVILVDDGLATGSSMRVAIEAVARQTPKRVVVAVPVGARATCDELAALSVEVVCPLTPSAFYAVGEWYDDFSPPTDEEIRKLLAPRAG